MIFNTAWFLVFFATFYVVFHLVPTARLRFLYVLAASAVFHYHFAGPAGVRPIIVMGVVTYVVGLTLPRLPSGTRVRSLAFAAGLLVPVLGLVFYKYRELLLGSLATVKNSPALAAWSPRSAGPALPLAISFFTFEFVHYLTDVHRGSSPIRNPLKFAFFTIFFPSIVSGPIKRFQPFLAQVEDGLSRPSLERSLSGAAQVLLGFFKKLVVADAAAAFVELLERYPSPNRATVATMIFLLSVRILFDFSGYSDIAIGLGRLIGLELPPNFRFPYAARNISEFWRRWHMSLSSWIRDYVYVPLGGGHTSTPRKALNLAVTMFICGLWHGPAWHFGLWGLYHGAGLAVHGLWERSAFSRRIAPHRGTHLLGIVVTDVFVAYGWLLFFYPVPSVVRYSRILLGLPEAP
jgi:alginate O-acetyltransferase complex protein AlgI